MKIIKPLSLGLLHRSYQQAGQNRLVVTVLGFFALGAPPAARLLPEAPQWGRLMKVLPTGQALDEVMPKASAEVMVLGHACAPGGRAVTQMPVRLQVGNIDKRLTVFGDRQWRYGTLPLFAVDPPAPFETMPSNTSATAQSAHFYIGILDIRREISRYCPVIGTGASCITAFRNVGSDISAGDVDNPVF